MDILGRDSAREAYRVAIGGPGDRVVGLVPDALIAEGVRLTGGRGHQTAYDWLSRHAGGIETAIRALEAGRDPEPPFAALELEGG